MDKNTGKQFEKAIIDMCAIYEKRGIARIQKVDPPTYFKQGEIRYKSSLFLDFIGWTYDYKFIAIELKSVDRDRLPLGKIPGITESQIEAIKYWGGDKCLILWNRKNDIKKILGSTLLRLYSEGIKSIRWDSNLMYNVNHYDFLNRRS